VPPGLTAAQVAAARRVSGWNEIQEHKQSAFMKVVLRFWGPIPWMLEVAAVLTGALQKWPDMGMVLGLLVLNAAISIFHDQKASAAVAALKSNLQVRAKVLRDGSWGGVPARELVPGDVLRLRAGDFVPADATIVAGHLTCDQAALTGESMPVNCDLGTPVLSGAVCQKGEATVVVSAVGIGTAYGKTTALVATSKPKLHAEAVVGHVAAAVVGLTVVLAVAMLIVVAARRQEVVESLPLLIMILVSGVPSALPAVFTLTMALGSRTLTARNVLITSLAATEDAAGMTYMCVDKTGTVTQNRLAVADVTPAPPSGDGDGGGVARVYTVAAQASSAANMDAIDNAVMAAAADAAPPVEGAAPAWVQEHFVPFDASLRRTEAVVATTDAAGVVHRVRVVKGAPKTLARLIVEGAGGDVGDTVVGCEPGWVSTAVAGYATHGCRALGVAASASLTGVTTEAAAAAPLQWVGLVALRDPPRADSASVVSRLHALGVHVVLLTGDATDIARAVATEVGIGDKVMSIADAKAAAVAAVAATASATRAASTSSGDSGGGAVVVEVGAPAPTLRRMESHGGTGVIMDRLLRGTAGLDGLAEVLPEHKHGVVRALQARGALVGMTGDGVNDAPALAQAEVGVAVAGATDVAKGAARAILMADGLSGVVDLVQVSRTVHARIETWILNKVSKNLLQAAFIAVAYWATGAFVLQAFHLILLLVLIDFVTLSVTTDNATGAARPVTWSLWPLLVVGLSVGACGLAESVGLLYVALHHMGYTAPSPQLGTFAMQIILYFCVLNVMVVRDLNGPMFSAPRPSATLAGFMAADVVIVVILSAVGAPALAAVPFWHCMVALAWAAFCTVAINGTVKVACMRYIVPRLPR